MTYLVLLSETAEREMDAILAWLAPQSPQGAHDWLEALEHAFAELETAPYSYGRLSEALSGQDELYEHYFGTRRGRRYRIIYEVTGNRVNVLHLRSPGQRPLSN